MISLKIKKVQKMSAKRKLAAAIGAGAIFTASFLPALAATTVTATVTPQTIAISVTDGTVSYGVLDVNGTNNTFDGAATADTQTITSDSNASTDVVLRSSDAAKSGAAGVTDWALAGTKGADQFVHSYDINASGSAAWTAFPSDGTFDNTNTATVVTLPNNADTATLDLKLDMPSSTTDASEHSIEVTAVASAT